MMQQKFTQFFIYHQLLFHKFALINMLNYHDVQSTYLIMSATERKLKISQPFKRKQLGSRNKNKKRLGKQQALGKKKSKETKESKVSIESKQQEYLYFIKGTIQTNRQLAFINIFSFHFFSFLRGPKDTKIVCSKQNLQKLQTKIQQEIDSLNDNSILVPLLTKIATNLINYNNFKPLEQNNPYIFNHDSNQNSKRFIDFAFHYTRLHPQRHQQTIQQNRQEPVQVNQKYQDSQLITLKSLFNKIQKYYYQMVKPIDPNISFQEKLNFFMKEDLPKRKTEDLLQFLQIQDAFHQKIQRLFMQQLQRMVSEIIILKIIKSYFVQLFHIINWHYVQFMVNQKDSDTQNRLYNCKLLGKYSNITNFLQIEYNKDITHKNQKRLYEEKCAPLILDESSQVDQQILEMHRYQTFDKHYQGLYLIDVLRFIKSTFQKGLAIKIQKQNLYIHNKMMKYKITQPFFISKQIKILTKDSYMHSFIDSNLSQLLYYKIVTEHENQINRRRLQHYRIVQENLNFCRYFFNVKPFPIVNYKQKDIKQLRQIYESLKYLLNLSKKSQELQSDKQIIQKIQKNQLIEFILISQIDLLINQSLTGFKIPFSQSLLVLKTFENVNSHSDFLHEFLFQNEEKQTYQILQKLGEKLKNINSIIDSGIIGVKEIVSDQNQLLIETDLINLKEFIILSEFSPQVARKHIFELCLPSKDFKQQKQQNHQLQKFTHYNAIQVVDNLINRLSMSLQNLSNKQIKCPLLLIRHLNIRNRWNKQNYPIIYPQINIINCYLDYLLLNKNKRPTQNEEFYINYNIKQLQLSCLDHNRLILIIFLLSLIHKDSESVYLQKVSKFFHLQNLQGLSVKKIAMNLYNFLDRVKDHSHASIYFSKLSATTIVPIFKHRVAQRLITIEDCMGNDKNLIDISWEIFSKKQQQILSQNPQLLKMVDQHGRLGQDISQSIFILRLTKEVVFLKKKYYLYPEEQQIFPREQSNYLQRYNNLLKLNFINMKYLYNQGFGCDSIKPIIKFKTLHPNKQTPHYRYYFVIQQYNYQNIFKNSYQNPYFKGQQYLLDYLALQNGKYLSRLQKNDKIFFIKQLYSIVLYSSQRQVQLLNLNIFTIKLIYSLTLKIFVPQFDDLQLCRIYRHEGQENRRLYSNYFQLMREQRKKDKYIENKFNILNYPPYNWQFQQQDNKGTVLFNNNPSKYQSQYDIGNLGYFLCLLLHFKKSRNNVRQYFQQKFTQLDKCFFYFVYKFLRQQLYSIQNELPTNQYKPRITKLHKEILSSFFPDYRQDQLPTVQFQSFLVKSIQPQISERLNATVARKALQNINMWNLN